MPTEPKKESLTPEDITRALSEWCRDGKRDGKAYQPTLRHEVEQTARKWEGS